MNDDLADVRERVRATYQAVADTTVLADDSPTPTQLRGPSRLRQPHRPRALVTAIAALALLIVAGAAALFFSDASDSKTTVIASVPITELVPVEPAVTGAELTCGAQLPRPFNVPGGYTGPASAAPSGPGQLVLVWSSSTGSIEARWPADPQNQKLAGRPGLNASTGNGQPGVAGAGVTEIRKNGDGRYDQTIVYSLRNVASGCETLQVEIADTDSARVAAGIEQLTRRGPFVSDLPLVSSSEARPSAPTVAPCNAPAGVAPANLGGPVSGAGTFATPTDALKSFVDAHRTLIPYQYLEIHLPDSSLVYAVKATPQGPFVTVIHIVQTGSGWSVDHWEASGC